MTTKRCLKCKTDLSEEDPAAYITCDECPAVLCAECDKKSNHMVCENDAVIRCLLCHRFHSLRQEMSQDQRKAIDDALAKQKKIRQEESQHQDQPLSTLTNNANGTHDARDTITHIE
jgi:hypothetical protein